MLLGQSTVRLSVYPPTRWLSPLSSAALPCLRLWSCHSIGVGSNWRQLGLKGCEG